MMLKLKPNMSYGFEVKFGLLLPQARTCSKLPFSNRHDHMFMNTERSKQLDQNPFLQRSAAVQALGFKAHAHLLIY
jgi:hypothetical protein